MFDWVHLYMVYLGLGLVRLEWGFELYEGGFSCLRLFPGLTILSLMECFQPKPNTKGVKFCSTRNAVGLLQGQERPMEVFF